MLNLIRNADMDSNQIEAVEDAEANETDYVATSFDDAMREAYAFWGDNDTEPRTGGYIPSRQL